ncbi:MAG: UbiA family prenyltransferase [Planctomycetes bacterium]|nr:UbiA family prenyltransferase [Planctomycetota bacterium]
MPSIRAAALVRLLRPRLLPSAAADVIAGIALAGVVRPSSDLLTEEPLVLVRGVLCGVLLYASGMVLGDVADVAEDRRLGRSRPITDGQVARTPAAIFGFACIASALVIAPGRLGTLPFVLAALVTCYVFVAKRTLAFGATTLAACRALDVMLGIALVVGLSNESGAHEPLRAWTCAGSFGQAALVTYALYTASCVVHGRLEDVPVPSRRISRMVSIAAALLPFVAASFAPHPFWMSLAAMPTLVLVVRSASDGDGWVPRRTGVLLRGLARFTFAMACGAGSPLCAAILAVPAWVLPFAFRPRRWT